MVYIFLSALFLSFVILWWTGKIAIDNANVFAKVFKIPPLIMGFLLVFVSTALPELFVIVSSHLRGATGMAVGTILGSNVSDVACVLALVVLAGGAIYIKKRHILVESILMLSATMIATFYVFIRGRLFWYSGWILIGFYFVVIGLIFKYRAKIAGEVQRLSGKKIKKEKIIIKKGFWTSKTGIILRLIANAALILVVSDVAVYVSIELSKILSLSVETIGATIFAFGTSLPELSVGISAIKQKSYSLVLGNIFGSVLIQGTLFLGGLFVFAGKPISVTPFLGILPFMIVIYIILGFSIVKYKKVGFIAAGLMFLIFILFFVYQLGWIR